MAEYPTRYAYAEALIELGEELPNLVLLDADVSKSINTMAFANKYPSRSFNFGIAEQNMIGAAAGLATAGLIPFASTYAVFASMRALEQIRTTVCYPRLNVKIGASHGGLTPGPDGATHQGIEDMALMRTLPNMTVIMPADAPTTRLAVRAAAAYDGPVYIRLTRDAIPILYEKDVHFEIGKSIQIRQGSDVTLIAIGDMVTHALDAADQLAKEGISARVLDMHTLKPLDEEAVLLAARETGAIVTVEDHLIFGALGSAVAEVLGENLPTPMKRIGIRDRFSESGPYLDLLVKYGLSAAHIAEAARSVLKRKK